MNTELLMLLCVAAQAQLQSGLKTIYVHVFADKGQQYMGAYMDTDTGINNTRIVDDSNWPVRAECSRGSKHWSFS